MRFWFSGPRIFGVRPGVSFSPDDLKTPRSKAVGGRIEGSFVYVVRGDHNMVKIGVTTNPRARLAQLRTGSAFPIDYAFIGVTPGAGFDIESAAHAVLDKYRCTGEWFDLSPEIAISAVMGAAGKLGYPMRAIDLTTSDYILSGAAAGGQENASENKFSNGVRRAIACLLIYFFMLSALALLWPTNKMPELAGAMIVVVFPLASMWMSGKILRNK